MPLNCSKWCREWMKAASRKVKSYMGKCTVIDGKCVGKKEKENEKCEPGFTAMLAVECKNAKSDAQMNGNGEFCYVYVTFVWVYRHKKGKATRARITRYVWTYCHKQRGNISIQAGLINQAAKIW